jgi:DNA-binding transcriptional regulator PaaX
MTTITSVDRDARTILAALRKQNVQPGTVLHYSGLCSMARDCGIQVREFRAAIEWLTSNGYLNVPKTPVDSYCLTKAGFERAA